MVMDLENSQLYIQIIKDCAHPLKTRNKQVSLFQNMTYLVPTFHFRLTNLWLGMDIYQEVHGLGNGNNEISDIGAWA